MENSAVGIVKEVRKRDGSDVENHIDRNTTLKKPRHCHLVSVIIPVYNCEDWLDECISSVVKSQYRPIEICVYNDASNDDTAEILQKWKNQISTDEVGLSLVLPTTASKLPRGSGFGKNRAVEASSGEYLCFIDADDIMLPERISKQLEVALGTAEKLLVGGNFRRIPEGSTVHYTNWANGLSNQQLYLQQYRECTLIMPTWFMKRDVFKTVGGFDEVPESDTCVVKKPIPEDLIFFLRHLELGGKLSKIESDCIVYRHRHGSVCSNMPRRTLLRTRIASFQRRVLTNWDKFTIWGNGRDGKNFFNDLSTESKLKVIAFCDVDPQKIGRLYVCRETKKKIPIIHFSDAVPPIVCCVAMGRTGGELEKNVQSLGLIEGDNFWHFI